MAVTNSTRASIFAGLYAAITAIGTILTHITTSNPIWAALITIAVFVVTWFKNYLEPVPIPSPTPTPVVTPSPIPAPPAPAPGSFTLDCDSAAPKIGDNFTLSIEGGTPGGIVNICQLQNGQAITVPITLDANGNGDLNIINLSTQTPLGYIIATQGTITLVAVDATSAKQSNPITLT